ncbi:MAG: hypothetical protein EOM05_07240 [Clostridia bacterium]|nr:hypothetical protein [Clostridia bacterium]
MKKKLSVFIAVIMTMSILTISVYAEGELHDSFTPSESLEAQVDGTVENFDETGENLDETAEADAEIGTDFYIVDYQDTILTYQLTVEVPMFVALAVVGDGEVAVPSATAYGLRNFSGYPVNITAVDVVDQPGGWTLVATPTNAKDIAVSLEGHNLLDLNVGSQTLSQLPAATELDGLYKAYAITATAMASQEAATTGYQFSVSYTLALDKS